MNVSLQRKRPFFLNLLKIRQPIGAVVSILHRITGFLLVLLLAPALYALDLSLRGPAGFERLLDLLGTGFGRLAVLLLAWVFAQHFYAGVRLLLLDLNIGVRLDHARASAWLTLVAAPLTALGLWALLP